MQGTHEVHGVKTPTRWLTNSGCIAQLLSTPTHPLGLYQTITEAVSQQLQSDLCVAVAAEQSPHRPSLPKLDILAVDADEGTELEWEAEDDVKRKPLNPQQKHGHERDATQCDSNGLIPTKVAQKHLVTARVWYVRRCPIRGSSRSSQQRRLWKICESCSVSRVKKTSLV